MADDNPYNVLMGAFMGQPQSYPNLPNALADLDRRARISKYGSSEGAVRNVLADGAANFRAQRDALGTPFEQTPPVPLGQTLNSLAYMVPGIGNALSARDAYNSYNQGDLRSAALGVLGAIPFAGTLGRGGSAMKLPEAVDHVSGLVSRLDDEGRFSHLGLRVTEEPLEVGSFAPPSRVWDDGVPTEETLNGASAVHLVPDKASIESALRSAGIGDNAASHSGYYYGKHVSILGSNRAQRGVDRSEIIMHDPVVLHTFEKEHPGDESSLFVTGD